jgi:hypothetical protein
MVTIIDLTIDTLTLTTASLSSGGNGSGSGNGDDNGGIGGNRRPASTKSHYQEDDVDIRTYSRSVSLHSWRLI